MKVAFYIKLLIAFIVFGIILLSFFFYISKNFQQRHYEDFSTKKVEEFIKYKKNIFENKITLNDKRLKVLVYSEAFKEFVNDKNKDNLIESFKNTLLIDEEIMEIKVVNSLSKELLIVEKSNNTIQINNQLELMTDETLFFNLLNLKHNEIWHSSLDLNYKKGELQYPINPVLTYAIRVDDNFVVLTMNTKKLLENSFLINNFDTYILDENGAFIKYKTDEYNWSKYFYPKFNIKKIFPTDYQKILKEEHIVSNEFISSRVYIDTNTYITVLLDFEKIIINEFEDSNYVIAIISIILLTILALIFANPIANLNKKLEDEKDTLNLSVIQNSNLLGDSLKLIDKYVMYIKFDKHRNILDVSSLLCEISGFAKSELIGQDYKMLLHKDMDFEPIFQILKEGKTYKGELKNRKKFGEEYWVKSNFAPNYDGNKNIVSFTEIRNNITYRKKIETLYESLNNQMEQLDAIFQNANSGIVLIDYKGNLENVNLAFSNLLGFSNDELIAKNIFDFILKERNEFFTLMLNQAKEFGSMSNIEVIFLSKNEEFIHLEISFSILPDKKHIVMVTNSLEDKRKLQELNSNLEQRVKTEVDKNRLQEKIYQDEQIKNTKLTSIGTLAAGITHEINTPLTYLKGNFEMIQYDIESLPDDRTKKNMLEDSEKINEAINRIENIVESMREMSQSSSEKKEKTNIYSTLITSLTMAFNMSKQISRIYLNGKLFTLNSLDKSLEIYFSNVQKQRIGQVWIIIINNALDELKKMADYEKRVLNISIKIENEDLVIQFKDNAGGINETIINTIFDPFVSSKEHSGMGLGLNIAKKIVEEQDGTITAFNEKDGAVFEIRLKNIS